VAEAAELWLDDCKRHNIEETTIGNYRTHINLHIVPLIGAMKLSEVTTPVVNTFANQLRANGRSADMARRVKVSLSSIFRVARGLGLVATSPTSGTNKKKSDRDSQRAVIPTKAELKAIIAAAAGHSPRWRAIVLTLVFAGLRASELRGLRWSDVDLSNGTLTVSQRADALNQIGKPKTRAGHRSIPLPAEAIEALRIWKLACPPSALGAGVPQQGRQDRELQLAQGRLYPDPVGGACRDATRRQTGRPLWPARAAARRRQLVDRGGLQSEKSFIAGGAFFDRNDLQHLWPFVRGRRRRSARGGAGAGAARLMGGRLMIQLAAAVHQQIYAAWVLFGASDHTTADRDRLFGLLAKHGLSIVDLPETFCALKVTAAPAKPKKKDRLWRLFGQLSSDNPNIWTTARKKLDALLLERQLDWNGFSAILLAYWNHYIAPPADTAATAEADDTAADDPTFNALELVLWLLEEHVVVAPVQRLVIALWALASHVYDLFEKSPRLGVISPASDMGKSRLLDMFNQLASEPRLTKNASPAAIYRRLERHPRTTYLLDEAENQNLLGDRVLRAVIDGGYERSGIVERAGEEFRIYFPCAYGLRGEINDVPAAVLSRSFIINMQRGRPKKKFRSDDPAFTAARGIIAKWRATASFGLEPELPIALRDPRNTRLEDNCLPLVAVADSFGAEQGEAARAALIALCAELPQLDSGVQALQDIRTVPFERIATKALVVALREMTYWDAWRGPNDQGAPHALSTGELSRLLRRFGIRARNHWPIPRTPGSRSFYGFVRADFEKAWAEHCQEDSTTPQSSKIMALVKP
jgi:integrase